MTKAGTSRGTAAPEEEAEEPEPLVPDPPLPPLVPEGVGSPEVQLSVPLTTWVLCRFVMLEQSKLDEVVSTNIAPATLLIAGNLSLNKG